MALDLVDFESMAKEAVMAFWMNRELSPQKQVNRDKSDHEEGSCIATGKNMEGFLALMKALVLHNGLKHTDIQLARRVLTLPGHFGPTKQWDMLVMSEGRLVAAVELKSRIAPMAGDDCSDRAEAIVAAHDLWTAYREGAFGHQSPPFVGLLVISEEFEKASHADRYDIMCRKLMKERLYTAASVIVAPRTAATSGEYGELSEMTGLRWFVAGLAGHVAAQAALKKR